MAVSTDTDASSERTLDGDPAAEHAMMNGKNTTADFTITASITSAAPAAPAAAIAATSKQTEKPFNRYKHIFPVHKQVRTSCLSRDSKVPLSFVGFKHLMVLMLRTFCCRVAIYLCLPPSVFA